MNEQLDSLVEELKKYGDAGRACALDSEDVLLIVAALSAQPRQDGKQATAWAEGYKAGISDEQTSAANIGIAGLGGKVGPARENPYGKPQPASAPVGVAVGWPKQDAFGNLDFDNAGDRPTDADYIMLAEGEAFVPVYLAQQPAAVGVPDCVLVLMNHLETLMDGGKLGEDEIPTEMWNAITNFIPAQQPKPAPVGVDGITGIAVTSEFLAGVNTALLAIAALPARDDESHEDAYRAVEALAQQPAAVDEAMERLHACPKLWYSDLVGEQISQLRMRAIVTAALAQPRASLNEASEAPLLKGEG